MLIPLTNMNNGNRNMRKIMKFQKTRNMQNLNTANPIPKLHVYSIEVLVMDAGGRGRYYSQSEK